MAWRRNRGESEQHGADDAGTSADSRSDERSRAGSEEASPPAEDDSRESGVVDISDTPAPSIGPHTTFEKPPPEERLARHEQSNVDAMGHDKRREVIGGSYGPSLARQATLYGLFLLVVAAIAFGFKVAVDEFDQPLEEYPKEAPWTNSQRPPDPLQ